MDGIWTIERVLALAPDAASARAAHGLADPRRWARSGARDAAVWGACLGSGSQPYEVAVDLGGPAYRCSCPSRKVPCKHALGLLLRLAFGTVPDEAPPEAVAAWLAGRRDRAERAGGRASGGTGDGQAREQTVARRSARIGAGLAELDRWLHDLIRQGLGAVQAQPYAFWDAMAARMVDAQAPGIASRLRRMAGIAAGGSAGWPGRLLEEAGLLHLATTAWARFDDLPDGLRADLRTVVGWPHRAEDVLAGPVTRDRWAVLAGQTDRDDRLQERRTWLWGLTTGRPALLLDFAPMRGGFATAVPPVGSTIDAELAFYPAAAPLRAIIATVHGTATPLLLDDAGQPSAAVRNGTTNGTGNGTQGYTQNGTGWADAGAGGHGPDRGEGAGAGAGAGLARHAAAVARNPWLDRFPMSLRGMLPERSAGGWALRDASGVALPIAPAGMQGWVLAAVAGGRPIGVLGEWRADAIRPLSALAGGRVVPLHPTACGWPAAHDGVSWHRLESGEPTPTTQSAQPGTLWGELVAAALLGTARRTPNPPTAAGKLGETLARVGATSATEPEGALLGAAATVTIWRRAGWRPDDDPAGPTSPHAPVSAPIDAASSGSPAELGSADVSGSPVPPAGRERLPRCGAAAGSRLALLLAPADGRDHSGLLPEWLALATEHGLRAPEELLPALLELGATRGGLQPAIWPVLGERGRWLAGQRAEWGWAGGASTAESAWREAAHPDARRLALGRLRRQDPDRGRELLVEAWPELRGGEAAGMLAMLGDGLGPADEPFLEKALDHPASKVRLAAIELATRLAGSRLAHRMTGRVRALFAESGHPDGLDRRSPDAWGPVGIVRILRPDAAAIRDGIQERLADQPAAPGWWLHQLAATAPLSAWPAATGRSPAELVRLADLDRAGDGEQLLLGWAIAAGREQDPGWAVALLEALDPAEHPDLLATLPAERAEALVLRALGTAAWGTHDRAWRLLRHYPTPWPERVQRTMLDLLVVAANGRDPDRTRLVWQYLGGFATRLDPALAVEASAALAAARTAPVWGRSVETFLDLLNFRRAMHAEMA